MKMDNGIRIEKPDLSNIPNEQIEKDIKDTEDEIKDYNQVIMILSKRPTENKLDIWKFNTHNEERREFVRKLREILSNR